MTLAQNLSPTIEALTPADYGIIATTLDDVADVGDDEAMAALEEALDREIGIGFGTLACALAYHIIHNLKRSI